MEHPHSQPQFMCSKEPSMVLAHEFAKSPIICDAGSWVFALMLSHFTSSFATTTGRSGLRDLVSCHCRLYERQTEQTHRANERIVATIKQASVPDHHHPCTITDQRKCQPKGPHQRDIALALLQHWTKSPQGIHSSTSNHSYQKHSTHQREQTCT